MSLLARSLGLRCGSNLPSFPPSQNAGAKGTFKANFSFPHFLSLSFSECQDLKSKVVEMIRSNQEMEQDLQTMDVKIGLLIRNRISLKDVIPTSQRVQPKAATTGQGAPGSHSYLGGFSKASQEKLEVGYLCHID